MIISPTPPPPLSIIIILTIISDQQINNRQPSYSQTDICRTYWYNRSKIGAICWAHNQETPNAKQQGCAGRQTCVQRLFSFARTLRRVHCKTMEDFLTAGQLCALNAQGKDERIKKHLRFDQKENLTNDLK